MKKEIRKVADKIWERFGVVQQLYYGEFDFFAYGSKFKFADIVVYPYLIKFFADFKNGRLIEWIEFYGPEVRQPSLPYNKETFELCMTHAIENSVNKPDIWVIGD